jgi:hypothetical protein
MNFAGYFKRGGRGLAASLFFAGPSVSDSFKVQVLFTTERQVKCSEDGEAETETSRAAKPWWRTMTPLPD